MKNVSDMSQSNWEYLKTLFPTGWEDKMKELGLLKYGRKFSGKDGASNLFRILLIHLGGNISLRSTCALAKEAGIVDVSDVALLKRLAKSADWFSWLTEMMLKEQLKLKPASLIDDQLLNFRFLDGSQVIEPGIRGSVWRLHYSMNASTLSADEIIITDQKTGESFSNHKIKKNDVIIGDRGYARRKGIFHVHENEGYTLTRFSPTTLPLLDQNHDKFDILPKLKGVQIGETREFDVVLQLNHKFINARICVIKKEKEKADLALKKIRRRASRECTKTKESTLEFAKYILIFTTLPHKYDTSKVLDIYRYRWQIELLFKRLKSIVGVAPLHKKSQEGMKGWLNGKVFVATLIEYMILCSESFFPWGYPIERE